MNKRLHLCNFLKFRCFWRSKKGNPQKKWHITSNKNNKKGRNIKGRKIIIASRSSNAQTDGSNFIVVLIILLTGSSEYPQSFGILSGFK